MMTYQKILIVAYAGHAHIHPAMRLANRLTQMGADVTLCTSLSVVQRIDKSSIPRGLIFAPFFDGHDNGFQPTTSSLLQYLTDFEIRGTSAIAKIIQSATATGQPFDYLVYTTALYWAAHVAHTHGIKAALLWCQSATMFDIYYYYFNDYQNLISSNNNNLTFPIDLPGLPPLTIGDLSLFMLSSCPKDYKFILTIMKNHIVALKITSTILVNTFNELEIGSIRAIAKLNIQPIGPLVPLEFLEEQGSWALTNDFFDKPEDDYIKWLDMQSKSSVVYVSFGTVASFSMEQLEEVARGLLEIGRPFLWVIRDGEKSGKLSNLEKLQKLGTIVSWCSQVVVLGHEAIGCFVMHGGWNSTLESLVAATPTVVFPQWSDQLNNAKMLQEVWKTGVKVKSREGDGVLEGKEMKRCVEIVMGNKEMKRNAEKWRDLAKEALKINGGSSIVNLQAFLDNACNEMGNNMPSYGNN
ncbi:UDP-glycosyltransferase 75C1-like [Rutidosis leptorrhynchoides]|uniref:UDP-glycosyltransferase 75C1-like n=1 Tax=Rutidosis leptorrhynchoides TaxID=125765 RepID=UPI003A9A6615